MSSTNFSGYKVLKQFLTAAQGKLLLALSGGADSLALFYLLLEYRKKHPIDFHVAHINHNWRKESSAEAEALRTLTATHGVPFHLHTIYPEEMKGNLEAASRDARFAFFKSLTAQFGFQATLLAHHADDLAETTLKRLFEGAALPYIGGLQEKSEREGIFLWRPLLSLSKATLEEWLETTPFEDATNFDPKFMRGRFRTRILPQLSKEFGKEISTSLAHVGKEASELRDYLDSRIEPYMKRLLIGPWGPALDLQDDMPHLVELKHLIRKIAGISLGRKIVEQAATFLQEGAANKCVATGDLTITIDRKRLFFIKTPLSKLPAVAASWQEAWQGHGSAILPTDPAFLRTGIYLA